MKLNKTSNKKLGKKLNKRLNKRLEATSILVGLLVAGSALAAAPRPGSRIGGGGRIGGGTIGSGGGVMAPPRSTSTIVKPTVVNPVRRRHRPVSPEQYNRNTRITVGQYNADGNIDGSVSMTGQEFESKFKKYKSRNVRNYQRTRPIDGRNLRVKTVTRFDRRLRQNVETTMVPQDFNAVASLSAQLKAFKPVASDMVMAPPGGSRPPSGQLKINYDKVWGQKSKFAAYVKAGFHAYGSELKRMTKATFTAGGYVFNKDAKMIDFSSTVSRGTGSSYTHFTVLGTKKWHSTTVQPQKEMTKTGSVSKRLRFWVGPLPVSVGAAIVGKLKINMKIESPTVMTIGGVVTPSIEANATADAAVDIWLARAGVEGKLLVLKESLPTMISIGYSAQNNTINPRLTVTNNLETLKGKFDVYAKVRKFTGGWKKWTKTIFSWSGIKATWKLIDRNIIVPI